MLDVENSMPCDEPQPGKAFVSGSIEVAGPDLRVHQASLGTTLHLLALRHTAGETP